MSIQWTFIAGYLYFEIALVTVMILPIFSESKWNQFFKSRLFSKFQQHAAVYFYILLGVLCLFLIDSIKDIKKYSHSNEGPHGNLASEMKGSIKLFRAQRNFYITGFSVFLAFVIRRLISMLIMQDDVRKEAAKAIKEAEVAVKFNTNQKNEAKNLIQSHKLTEALLEERQDKIKELEEEVRHWKTKYLEATTGLSNGKDSE